jgi:CubicO group peptidase (beta-lactamase class C family)
MMNQLKKPTILGCLVIAAALMPFTAVQAGDPVPRIQAIDPATRIQAVDPKLALQSVPHIDLRSKAVSAPPAEVSRKEMTGVGTIPLRAIRPPIRIAIDKEAMLVKRVADNLEKNLKDKSVGYSFQVAYNDGHLVARSGGVARRAPDGNPRKFVTDDKITIASVSKTLTAITLLKLLDEKKIDVDKAIGGYFPASINVHPTMKAITFRELLTHHSGIRSSSEQDYAVLLNLLATGINPANKKLTCDNKKEGLCYDNANFAMFRILIPAIENGFEPPANLDNYAKSYMYGIRTMEATKKRVFEPLGIANVFCASGNSGNGALSYQFPGPVKAGQDWGDMTATNAYRGWNLSAPQMSAVIRSLMFTEKLLPKTVRDNMLAGQLGIWHDSVAGFDEFGHGGYHPGAWNQGEINTMIVGYSNGISVSLIVNSQYGPGLSLKDAINPAFTDAVQNVK